MLEAYNLVLEHKGRVATLQDIDFRVDLPQFFDFYKEVNAKGVAKRAGINSSLLAQYISGHKKPSPKQVGRISEGIRSLGREMASLDLVL
jgi:predicted transcriptional regulator